MTSNTRLRLGALMISLSALFAVLLAWDPQMASAAASIYVALFLTAFVLSNVWKKP